MRGKLWFLGGLAAGFVLGARAGREKYEEMVQTARKIKEHPTVQEATGVAQEQANRLITQGKDKLSQSKLAETRIGERLLSKSGTPTGSKALEREDTFDDTLAMSGTTTSPTTGSTAGPTSASTPGSSYSTGTDTTVPSTSTTSTPSPGTGTGTGTSSTSGY